MAKVKSVREIEYEYHKHEIKRIKRLKKLSIPQTLGIVISYLIILIFSYAVIWIPTIYISSISFFSSFIRIILFLLIVLFINYILWIKLKDKGFDFGIDWREITNAYHFDVPNGRVIYHFILLTLVYIFFFIFYMISLYIAAIILSLIKYIFSFFKYIVPVPTTFNGYVFLIDPIFIGIIIIFCSFTFSRNNIRKSYGVFHFKY